MLLKTSAAKNLIDLQAEMNSLEITAENSQKTSMPLSFSTTGKGDNKQLDIDSFFTMW